MIHARKDYARIQDPDKKIPVNEPVFLLRGQDQVAAEVVRIWAVLNRSRGGDSQLSRLAETQASLMDNWCKHKPADLQQ